MSAQRRLKRSGGIDLAIAVGGAFLLILVTTPSSGAYQPFRSGKVGKLIEETAVRLTASVHSQTRIADVGALAIASGRGLGQGGEAEARSTSNLSLVQANSVVADAPVLANYLDLVEEGRNKPIQYEVQPGDSLSLIAADYGVSMNSILWSNTIKNPDNLTPGQVLRIPPVSGVIHKVIKGDTVTDIAKDYDVSVETIKEFNRLGKSDFLAVGDDLIIPGGRKGSASSAGQVAKYAPTTKSKSLFSYLPDLGDFFKIPTVGFNWGTIHGRNGVDVANSCGTPVLAAADGTVLRAVSTGWNGGYGENIVLSHTNETETLYAHLSKLLVKAGDTVEKGQQIALMGTTGRSTGCHLHFEVHGAKNPLAKY